MSLTIVCLLCAISAILASPVPATRTSFSTKVAAKSTYSLWNRPDPSVFGVTTLGYLTDLQKASVSATKIDNGYTFIVAQSPMPESGTTVTVANWLLYNKSRFVQAFGRNDKDSGPTIAAAMVCSIVSEQGSCTLANIASASKETWVSRIGTAVIPATSAAITAKPVEDLQASALKRLRKAAQQATSAQPITAAATAAVVAPTSAVVATAVAPVQIRRL